MQQDENEEVLRPLDDENRNGHKRKREPMGRLMPADDPFAPFGRTMVVVLVGEVSHKTPWFEDPGGRQLGMLTSELDGPHTIPHVLQVAGRQRVAFVA